MTSNELLKVIKEAAESKKARDIVQIDLRKRSDMTDFFVVCEGDTDRQTKAIADGIRQATTDRGWKPFTISGERDGAWILLDYIEVIVHVFLPGERSFYDLETLWTTAPMLEVSRARDRVVKAIKPTVAKPATKQVGAARTLAKTVKTPKRTPKPAAKPLAKAPTMPFDRPPKPKSEPKPKAAPKLKAAPTAKAAAKPKATKAVAKPTAAARTAASRVAKSK